MTASSTAGGDTGGGWQAVLLDRWRLAQDRSVVGPGDPQEHLDRALALARVLDPAQVAVDLGSGAGIPGLALAGAWPGSRWVLLDASQRRVRLLEDSVAALGWETRVTVVHGRAEDVGRDATLRASADLVTSRSFGPPAVAAECGAPFLTVGGILAVSEPPDSTGERWPAHALEQLGVRPLGVRGGVQLLRADRLTPEAFPRRPGVPTKRPLF